MPESCLWRCDVCHTPRRCDLSCRLRSRIRDRSIAPPEFAEETLEGGCGRPVGAVWRLEARRDLRHRLGNGALSRTARRGVGLGGIARASFNLEIAAADLASDPAGRAEMQEPFDHSTFG